MSNAEYRFTKDFYSIISIVKWNSLGFFFLEFLVPFVASQELRASGVQMGIIFSAQVFGYALSSPFVGAIADRYSKVRLALIGSVGRGIAYFIIYSAIVAKILPAMAFGTFSIGFMAGFFWIPLDTLISEKSDKHHRSSAFGIRSSALGQGTLFGAFAGFGILGLSYELFPGNNFLLYSALPLFGLANFYAGILFIKNVDEKLKFEDSNQEVDQDVHSTTALIPTVLVIGLFLLLGVLFLSTVNGSLAKPFLQVYLLENIENDVVLAALAYAPSGTVSMLLAPKLGEIADRINPLLGITITSIIGAFVTWLLINTTSLWVFAGLLVIDVTVVVTNGLILANIISRVSQKHRGKIFGAQSTASNIGAIAGPIIGGTIWDIFGMKSPFIFSILVELALIPVYLIAVFLIRPHLAESLEN
ncbi:MAG: MFS transporter [Candidatus Hodarchaeota archaeon]